MTLVGFTAQFMRYVSGQFELNRSSRRLYVDGQPLPINQLGIDILLYLIELDGETATKAALLKAIWADESAKDPRLTKQISLLRQAIEDAAPNQPVIITVPGIGYRVDKWELLPSTTSSVKTDEVEAVRSIGPTDAVSDVPQAGEIAAPAEPFPPVVRAVVKGRRSLIRWRNAIIALPLLVCLSYLFLSIVSQIEVHSNFGPTDIKRARQNSGFKRSLKFSRDGASLAYYQSSEPEGAGRFYIINNASNSNLALPENLYSDEEMAWAPDNRSIALLRSNGSESSRRQLIIASLDGQQVRNIAEVERYGIDWSPNGRDLAVCERHLNNDGTPSGIVSIHLLESDGSNFRRLNRRNEQFKFVDSHPRFSPDGSRIALFRSFIGKNYGEIHIVELASGEEQILLRESGSITQLEWSPNGNEILFISTHGVPHLWSIPANRSQSPHSPGLVTKVNDPIRSFSISRRGDLAYVGLPGHNSQIDLLPLPKSMLESMIYSLKRPDHVPCTINSGNSAYSPTYSPDSKKVAFVSDLSGTEEIWIANADCTNYQQVTFINQPESNRNNSLNWLDWSDDGNRIAFTRRINNQTDIYYLDVTRGHIYQLTDTPGSELKPFWSQEAGVIYYGWKQDRLDDDTLQIRRLDLITRKIETVIEDGDGHFSEHSSSSTLYFTRHRKIWIKDLKTGKEREFSSLDAIIDNGAWEIYQDSIYVITKKGASLPTLFRLNLTGNLRLGNIERVLDFDLHPIDLDHRVVISPDGRSMANTNDSSRSSEISFLNYLK